MFRKAWFFLNRLRERLWIKPLLMCLLSLVILFTIGLVDRPPADDRLPIPSLESVITLLEVLSSSMLVIAILAVTSMVASYNSASNSATPRAFPLIVSDDLSQFALSTFISAFIYSVTALLVVQNDYYGSLGLLAVTLVTLAFFAAVIITFMRWVDGIARLGLLGNTIGRIERATQTAMAARLRAPTLGGAEVEDGGGVPIHADTVGYVQLVNVAALQEIAESIPASITVQSLPGRLVMPGRALVTLVPDGDGVAEADPALDEALARKISSAFVIGRDRTFDDDPRFGLVALSQIACRALSPAINDPGTAIDILASFLRLFNGWCNPPQRLEAELKEPAPVRYPRVAVPRLSLDEMFEDAFAAIGRDGAANVEVAVRLQQVLASLGSLADPTVEDTARRHAALALARAEKALAMDEDRAAVREASPAAVL